MKLLLVDDDPELLVVTALVLEKEGFTVVQAGSVAAAVAAFRREQPALVLLDINLPDGLGFDVCRRIRVDSQAPILMLTVRGEEEDLVQALEIGADDYLTKPYSPRTLVARVKALLRRAGVEAAGPQELGRLRLDGQTLTLKVGGQVVAQFTRLEYSLLQLLIAHVNEPVHADRMLAHVWGRKGGGDRQVLKQLVHRLRHKVGEQAGVGLVLETVPGVGYRLVVAPGETTG